MSWRNIIITKPARLSLKQNHLVVKQEEEVSVPLEDVSVIVVETPQALITSRLLDELARKSIPLFTCDPGHLPSGLFLSFHQHSRFLKVMKGQLEQTLPFRKNCWRLIVKQKIKNQAICLDILNKECGHELRAIASEVKSGDPDNREGMAARVYFNSYMPSTTRQEDNTVNAALNYGYTIMRGAVARSLTAYGFMPAIGLHHRSEVNAFNLADDFMEVLRPVVDLWVGQNVEEGKIFSIKERSALVSLLNSSIMMDFEKQSVFRAIDIMSISLSTATTSGEPEKIKLPELIPLSRHAWN